MDKDQLTQRLLALFVDELDEHLRTLNHDLIALEAASVDPLGRAAPLSALFRTIHIIKGSSRSASVQPIEAVCHQLETLLAEARDATGPLRPEMFTLFFAVADAFADARRRLMAKQSLDDSPVAAVLARLKSADEPAVIVAEPVAAAQPNRPSVRVAADKLDTLLARVSEVFIAQRRIESRAHEVAQLRDAMAQMMVFHQRTSRAPDSFESHVERLQRDIDKLSDSLFSDWRALARATRPLDEDVRRVRMLPFAEAAESLDRTLRDLTMSSGKRARLVVEGGELELDRALIETLKDPLLHLVRNALDHGIESHSDREAAGKKPEGTVTVRADLSGAHVRVSVSDDGGGLDREAIGQEARRRNLAATNDRELLRTVFSPGFSTARMITDISGRGVGLDVVRSQVEGMHGTVELSSAPGRGTTFTLILPLTLTTLRALMVSCAGQTFAVALSSVARIVRFDASELRSIEGREVLVLDGVPIAVVALGRILGVETERAKTRHAVGILLGAEQQQVVFVVDEALAEQDIVVKNLGPRLKKVRFISGATLLPTGDIALILHVAHLVAEVTERPQTPSLEAQLSPKKVARRRILLADDSVTTRALEKGILESAGYEVTAAVDGAEAWRILQEVGADLLVSDVEMPRMDGFELTETIRRSPRFRDLPVILVTALDHEGDRKRGLVAGANAYLVKSGFDQQNLLATVEELIR